MPIHQHREHTQQIGEVLGYCRKIGCVVLSLENKTTILEHLNVEAVQGTLADECGMACLKGGNIKRNRGQDAIFHISRHQ